MWTKEQQINYAKQHYQDNKDEYKSRSLKRYAGNKQTIAVYSKKRYESKKELILAQFRGLRKKIKIEVLAHYSTNELCCASCGIDDIDVLCLDHIDGGGTAERRSLGHPSSTAYYRYLRRKEYPKGYQVLCANCNLKKRIQKENN